MEFHGYPWNSTDIESIPQISMESYGFPWKSMDIHLIYYILYYSLDYSFYYRFYWISMEIHGNP